MAAVTICSDFGAKKKKPLTISIVSPSICHEMMGLDAIILVFRMWSQSLNKPKFQRPESRKWVFIASYFHTFALISNKVPFSHCMFDWS